MAGERRLFRVDVEQTHSTTFYVQAENYAAAEADARVLGHYVDEWDDYDTDISTMPARTEPDDDAPVWTGGESGTFRTWGEISGR